MRQLIGTLVIVAGIVAGYFGGSAWFLRLVFVPLTVPNERYRSMSNEKLGTFEDTLMFFAGLALIGIGIFIVRGRKTVHPPKE